MVKILLILLASLILSSPQVSLAHSNKDEGQAKIRIKIENQETEDNNQGKVKFETAGQKFEISGEISSVSQNSIVILGQTIVIDLSKVSKFEQKGILTVGNFAKVEGEITDGVMYAREIKVIGTGHGRFKFEVKGLFSNLFGPSPTPSPSPAPSGEPSSSPTVTPSPSPTPTATSSTNVQVKIKANGPLDQVVAFLEQVLKFLQGLI